MHTNNGKRWDASTRRRPTPQEDKLERIEKEAAENPLWVRMAVYSTDDSDEEEGVLINQRKLNFKSPSARQLIARTAWWAVHEGFEIVTHAVPADEEVEHVDSREWAKEDQQFLHQKDN
jgi:hypothetical protein